MNNKTCLLITIWKNRTHLLRKSLERLSQLTLPDEILVINDGNDEEETDRLLRVLQEFDFIGLPIRYIYTHNPGLTMCSHARNVGIKNTECDFIICSEPEVAFITDVIPQLVQAYNQHLESNCINAGTIYRVETDLEMTEDMLNNPDNYNLYKRTGWSGNCVALYKRDWLLQIGGWDEEFPRPYMGDDVDINERLSINDHHLITDDSIVVLHQYHPKEDFGSNIDPNMNYLKEKNVQLYKERVVANRNHEWGKIKIKQ